MHRSLSLAVPAWTLLGALLLVAGCDGQEAGGPMSEGERVFRSVVEDGNTFTCATCHAIREPSDDGLRRVGHPLFDAARRPSYKNGTLLELRGAVDSCLQEWMNAEPWDAEDERWLALEQFLDAQAPDQPAAPLRFELAAPPFGEQLEGGDAAAGRALFNASCAACHGTDASGTQQGPPLGGLDPAYAARRVRTSGRTDSPVYDGLTGGVMPFWAADRLSDDELRDLVAWLRTGGGEPDSGDPSDPTDPPEPGGCASTHRLVGASAVLDGNFHDVGGIAEVFDDCTIVLRDFTYDGGGIDVRVYGALNGDYDQGFAISDDLRRSGGYQGQTLTLRLPPGRTLDDLDGVSIWCVAAGVDFGSGDFTP